MPVSDITRVSLTCPHCGATNQLHSDSGTDGLDVNCSKCHRPMGQLGKLKELAAGTVRDARRV